MCGQDVVGGIRGQSYSEEPGLAGEDEAVCPLVCVSAGAEVTIVIMFVGKYLSSMHAAPKEDG